VCPALLASLTLGHAHQDSALTLKTSDPLPCHCLLTSSQPEPGLCMQSVRTVTKTDWVCGGTATLVLQPTSPRRTPFRRQTDKSLGGAGSAGAQMSHLLLTSQGSFGHPGIYDLDPIPSQCSTCLPPKNTRIHQKLIDWHQPVRVCQSNSTRMHHLRGIVEDQRTITSRLYES